MIKEFKTTYVFGDLHADYYTFRNMLIDLRIIDRNGRMVAKDIYIVQIGDVLRKGRLSRTRGEEATGFAGQPGGTGTRLREQGILSYRKPRIHELHRRF